MTFVPVHFGEKSEHQPLLKSIFACPNCNTETTHTLYRSRKTLSVYGLGVSELNYQLLLQCDTCFLNRIIADNKLTDDRLVTPNATAILNAINQKKYLYPFGLNECERCRRLIELDKGAQCPHCGASNKKIVDSYFAVKNAHNKEVKIIIGFILGILIFSYILDLIFKFTM
jgi:transcription elongation factor Elf1